MLSFVTSHNPRQISLDTYAIFKQLSQTNHVARENGLPIPLHLTLFNVEGLNVHVVEYRQLC